MSGKTPSQSDSTSLEQLFIDFAELIFKQIESRASTEGIPRRRKNYVHFYEDGGWDYKSEEKVDYGVLLNYDECTSIGKRVSVA